MSFHTLFDLQLQAGPHVARRLNSMQALVAARVSLDTETPVQQCPLQYELSSGSVVLRLPYPGLCSLQELLSSANKETRLTTLFHLSAAASRLPVENAYSLDPRYVFTIPAPAALSTSAFFLFLPAAGAADLRRLDLSSQDRQAELSYDPPERTGSGVTAFGLAALWYTSLSTRPFCLNMYAEPGTPRIHERFSESFPQMNPEIQQALDACIEGTNRCIEQLHQSLGQSFHGGTISLFRELQPEDERLLYERAELARTRRLKRLERSNYIRTRGARVAVLAVIVVSLGAVLGTSLSRALQPPPTLGLPPVEVVRLHYESINALDPELLSATLARGVARRRVDEITTLYVASRARYSVEMLAAYQRADTWIAEGRPELPPSVYPYGVSTPDIGRVWANNTTAVYEARFTRVDFFFEDSEPELGARVQEDSVRELLQLELRNRVWQIVSIRAEQAGLGEDRELH